MRKLLALLLCCCSLPVLAQLHDNIYRNANNEHYWRNRMPDAAYWQQDVAYKINATMHEDEHRIEGTEELSYWNNSPDTLQYVYFHLYQNAFVKGSYLHELEKVNKVKARMGKNEAAGKGTEVAGLTVDGVPASVVMDNTIMRVNLPVPLKPGQKIDIRLTFNTWYDNGTTRRRMQMWDAWGFKHYNGCQWYPKISVYDRMHGWDTYQHLNKEFYGDYGVFDVTLDFPSNYVLEATGALQNVNEVLPADLRAKLDIKNFANKKWEEAPSIITPYVKGERKRWHYIANNVHDFAFTADPSYRIGTAYWNGIECVAIAQESHAARWQNAAEYVASIIKMFSEDIGSYRYPKMVAADARDGMEYPMITLDGGADPGYRDLFIHEIGHNWFYGQVGSNETYRAAMDEGFTQFLTVWGYRRLEGDTVHVKPGNWYRKLFAEDYHYYDRRLGIPYNMSQLMQNELPLNTHSDDFHNALNHDGGYGTVYYKTANMLYNLQYVLGDSLFQAALHHYFEQWKFAHPYFEDFRASVIQFTHVDLSWFFDEWFETTKPLDISVCKISRQHGDDYKIKLSRKGDMQMPVDLTVHAKDGTKYDFHIPNTWFVKRTNAMVLPKWYGWGALGRNYIANVQIPGGIKDVQIDTTFRLADRNLVDNYRARGLFSPHCAVKLKLDGGTYPSAPDRRHYRLWARPDLWYNPIDGIKAGLHLEGDYLNMLDKLDATIWWNTHVLQGDDWLPYKGERPYVRYSPVNYSFNYSTPVSLSMAHLQFNLNSRYLDGLWLQRAGFSWSSGNNTVQVNGQGIWRPKLTNYDYLLAPGDWSGNNKTPNISANIAWNHTYKYYNGTGSYTLSARAPFMTDFNYAYMQFECINNNYVKKLEVKTRFFARYGLGTALPQESLLYAAGASPEELMENKYTRSIGFVPDDWRGISRYDVNHFQQGGGLNLRGYSGYNMPDEKDGVVYQGYKGRSGIAGNVEIDFDNYIPFRPGFTRNWLHVDLYAFADAGIMELSSFSKTNVYAITPANKWSDIRVDAGLGTAFTIKRFGVFDKAKPLTIRLDAPLFLNRPPYGNTGYFTARYVVGVNRAF